MEEFLYETKPYMLFVAGFMVGQMDHPAKWISAMALVGSGVMIKYWRHQYKFQTA